MIIDSHVHLLVREWLSPRLHAEMAALDPSFDEHLTISGRGETLAAYLETQGLDYALMLQSYHDLMVAGEQANVYLAELCANHHNIIPIAYIDYLAVPQAAQLLEKLVLEFGMKGLKLHPPSGFYPNDAALYPLYTMANKLDIPVFLHIGSTVFSGMRIKYSRPLLLDDVAVDFPDLTIVMIHCGRGCHYDEAFLVSKLHRNIYMDVTGLPPEKLLAYFPELEQNAAKLIFGSDWPTIPRSIPQNIAAVRKLPLREATIEGMLGANIARLMDKHNMWR